MPKPSRSTALHRLWARLLAPLNIVVWPDLFAYVHRLGHNDHK